MTEIDSWLAATWAFVRRQLPDPPATVLEIGCGPQGGLVPLMLEADYDALGVDPDAPEGPGYQRIPIEQFEATRKADSVIASASLHHVADLAEVLDKVTECLTPHGSVVVVEWDWERFDDQTSQWCFARLAKVDAESSEHSWLRSIHDEWIASGQPWQQYWRSRMSRERLHTGHRVLNELNSRYDCHLSASSPYFFPELNQTSEADEQAAINAGEIQAGGIRFVGYVKHQSDKT